MCTMYYIKGTVVDLAEKNLTVSSVVHLWGCFVIFGDLCAFWILCDFVRFLEAFPFMFFCLFVTMFVS